MRGFDYKRCQRGFLRRMELERIKDIRRAQPAPFLLFSIFAIGYTPGIKPPEAVRGQDALQSGAASGHRPTPFCSPGEGLVTGTGPGHSIFSPDGSSSSTQMGQGGCALRFPAASPLQPLPGAGAPSHSLAEGSPHTPSYQQLEVFPRQRCFTNPPSPPKPPRVPFLSRFVLSATLQPPTPRSLGSARL